MRFDDTVALVTGAGSGIGRAIAMRLADEGASIFAVDINRDAVTETIGLIGDASRTFAEVADVSEESEVAGVVACAIDRLGRVDVLCNNAGVLDDYIRVEDTTTQVWQRVIGVNLTAPFLLSRAVLPHMVSHGRGAIVNTASIAAFVAGGGGAAYTASKHGILGLTRQLAFEYGPRGIRVNAVCPGAIDTGMTAHLFTAQGRNAHVDEAIAGTPAGRWGQPDEVARVVAFLASDDAAFVHGAAYSVDGGWLVA